MKKIFEICLSCLGAKKTQMNDESTVRSERVLDVVSKNFFFAQLENFVSRSMKRAPAGR